MNEKTEQSIEDKNNSEDKRYNIGEVVNDQIPSILTLSLREILKFYGKSILELKAKGGIFPHDRTILDEDYGVVFSSGDSNVIEINYEQRRRPDGSIINPLDNIKIEEIIEHLDENLPEFELKDKDGNVNKRFPPDIPVDFLKIDIKDDKIKELAGAETNDFDAIFKSEKAEKENIKKEIHKLNKGLGVYYQGFEIRNLNLFQLIERARKLVEPKKVWKRISIVQWDGYTKQHLRPKSPIAIAQQIYENYLPPGYKSLKKYLITKENKLELDGYKVG
ncbi:MAG: hypothetical protein ACFFDF_01100 [Candidatus Odinarchaeota archaeon]